MKDISMCNIHRRPMWRPRTILSQFVLLVWCVSCILALLPVRAQKNEISTKRIVEGTVVSLRALQGPKGDNKGPGKGKGKSSKKKGKGTQSSKAKGKKSKGKNAATLSPAPSPLTTTSAPTLTTSTLSPTGFQPTRPSQASSSPNLPPNAKSARRPSTQPTTAPSLPSKVKSKSKKPTFAIPTKPTKPTASPVRGSQTGPTLPPSSKTKPTSPTSNSTSSAADVSPTASPSSPAFAFSRSIAAGPVTIEYGGVLDLAQKEDAIFMAVESVLTPYLQQNVGTALRNYELTLTYTQGPNPNTYLSNIKVILVLAGNSAQAVQGLTQDEAKTLLLDFFTGTTLKSLGNALLAAGVKVTTLGLYQQPSGTTSSNSTNSIAASGTKANASGSRLGPTGYASIIAGGALVILASVAIMRRRRQSEAKFRHFLSKSKDDSSMTSSTEIDDGAGSVKRMGIRPAMFPSKKNKENLDGIDLSATRQLIDKYRVLASSATELTDDFANQSTYESEGRNLSSDGSTWSLAYHDAVDPLDHMSVDSTESMSTTDHHEYALAICPVPSAELRMLHGPDLIAATTLPGSAPWTARSYSFSSSSSVTQRLEEGMPSAKIRRRWHDESEGEEVKIPEFTPSVNGDAGSVASQN